MKLRSTAVIIAALVACTGVVHAQKEPKRPKLQAQADTNDPHAYYDYAIENLKGEPERAADALYWATRLEPTWAEAYYARRIALLLSDRRRLTRYWTGEKSTVQSDAIRRIDSLFYYALTLNPFVTQRLDRMLYDGVVDEITVRYENQGYNGSEVRYAIERESVSWPASVRAWYAYGDGRYEDALKAYAQAIASDKRNGPLHIDRARVFFHMGRADSALVEMTAAIEDLRKRDKKDLIYVYQSKALTEHSIGVIQQQLGHVDAAREAFGRALQEDLSYYPAHLQLAFMALDAKDTTTALSEMDLAMQLRGDDPAARYMYGFTLAASGKVAEAEPQLRKAVELNPVYAAPHFTLAQVLERANRPADALGEYRAFLARASKSDLRRPDAQARATALGSTGGAETRR